jgi:hypothetical protein
LAKLMVMVKATELVLESVKVTGLAKVMVLAKATASVSDLLKVSDLPKEKDLDQAMDRELDRFPDSERLMAK